MREPCLLALRHTAPLGAPRGEQGAQGAVPGRTRVLRSPPRGTLLGQLRGRNHLPEQAAPALPFLLLLLALIPRSPLSNWVWHAGKPKPFRPVPCSLRRALTAVLGTLAADGSVTQQGAAGTPALPVPPVPPAPCWLPGAAGDGDGDRDEATAATATALGPLRPRQPLPVSPGALACAPCPHPSPAAARRCASRQELAASSALTFPAAGGAHPPFAEKLISKPPRRARR